VHSLHVRRLSSYLVLHNHTVNTSLYLLFAICAIKFYLLSYLLISSKLEQQKYDKSIFKTTELQINTVYRHNMKALMRREDRFGTDESIRYLLGRPTRALP